MLLRVPGATSSDMCPGTTTMPGLCSCFNTRWLPRILASYQPSPSRRFSTSHTFIISPSRVYCRKLGLSALTAFDHTYASSAPKGCGRSRVAERLIYRRPRSRLLYSLSFREQDSRNSESASHLGMSTAVHLEIVSADVLAEIADEEYTSIADILGLGYSPERS